MDRNTVETRQRDNVDYGEKRKKEVSVPIPHSGIDVGSTLILTVNLLEKNLFCLDSLVSCGSNNKSKYVCV